MSLGTDLLQYLFTGLTLGGIYALIALGFVTIFSVTGILNFTQGEFTMLGALLAVSLLEAGLPLWLAALLAVLLGVGFGALLERVAIAPAHRASPMTLVIITIGASIALRGIALLIWGTSPYMLPAFSAGAPLMLGGAVITRQSLWVLGIALAVVAAFFHFFQRTVTGLALRACMINKQAARLMGIRPQRMSLLIFALAGGVGALAGVSITPITTATYDMGLMLGLKGFVAAILGGLTNPAGAVLGGFVLGVLEAVGGGLMPSGYKDVLVFLVLLLVLYVRPTGLLGAGGTKRV